MDFGEALKLIKSGSRLCRAGWNGKGMYLYLGEFDTYEPCIIMKTVQGKRQPGWLASQADMLANDWELVVN